MCQRIAGRVDQLPDARSRQLIGDGLTWAAQNPDAIGYNVGHADDIKQISPNIIGFQFVMHGIAKRIMQRGKRASRIVVNPAVRVQQGAENPLRVFRSSVGY